MTIQAQLPAHAAALVPPQTTAATQTFQRLTVPTIAGIGSAVPERIRQDDLRKYFQGHFGGHPLAERVWNSCKTDSRHLAVDPRREPVFEWRTSERMQRHLREASPLGKKAVSGALETAGLHPRDIGFFAVVCSTGYA